MTREKILGIDLGTTYSAYAIMEGDDPEIIINSDGERTMPSVVAFTEDKERLVGKQAKNQAVQNPDGTVESIKRHMGKDDYVVDLHGETYTPEEISAMILQRIKQDAEDYLGHEVENAVITVPAYFSDSARQATKDAGELAGLTVERLVNEPTAAAMAYGKDEHEPQTILVYDLGGGTFDVSILHLGDGIYDVLATNGDKTLGGDDWDQEIMDWLLNRFNEKHGIDLRNDQQALQRIRDAAEEAKIELSTRQKTSINLPFIAATESGPVHLEEDINREKFEDLTEHLVERTVDPTQQALNDAGYTMEQIDEVLLVGGATRMPMIQERVEKARKSINPDEVVALGAAVQGGIISGSVNDTVLLDVTPLSLGIEVDSGLFKPLIKKNTTIPTEESNVFTTSTDNQTTVQVKVYQGEREIAEENELLGEFTLAGIPPAPAGTPKIKVTFSIDENGIVQAEAEDLGSGSSEEITITGGTGMSEEEIEQMKIEAEKHAPEDKMRRQRIEAENEIERAIKRSEVFFDDFRDDIPKGQLKAIDEQVERAERVLREGSSSSEELEEIAQSLNEAIQAAGEQVHELP